LAVSAPVVWEPLIALVPDQPPEAVQAVAFFDDHVKVDAAPFATVLGLALKLTVGAGAVTDTVADWLALPPVPVQVSTYVALADRAPVDCEPDTALLPDQAPEAAHEVALVADQVRVDAAPLNTELGLAASVTVGKGALTDTLADCAALPPAPVHVNV
jgi:hypothetical protein